MTDNFDELIADLKPLGARLSQAHEELKRRLFGSGGAKDPRAGVRVPGTGTRRVGRERSLSKNLTMRCAWKR